MTASFLARIPRRKSGLCSSVWAENLTSMWFLLPIIVVFGVLTIVPLSQSFFLFVNRLRWLVFHF